MKRILVMVLLFVSFSDVQADPKKIKKHGNAIPERYMVLLNDNVSSVAYQGIVDELAAKYDFTIVNRWDTPPFGFVCADLKASKVLKLAADLNVSIVEEDFAFSAPITSGTIVTTWNNESLWHLDRLDEPTYAARDFTYDMCPEGRNVYAYIIDQGVYREHEEFTRNEPTSRVVYSRAFDDGTVNGYLDTTSGCTVSPNRNLDRRHGSAVASVLAGASIGAAKTQVISLRIFRCDGSSRGSWIVNAVRWIRSAADPFAAYAGLVNMSAALDPFATTADFFNLNAAVTDLVTHTGIPFFTSANNYAGDACKFSPASLAYTNVNQLGKVFTVGGTALGGGIDVNDYRWQKYDGSGARQIGQEAGSNGGNCVSMYAPATDIYVATTDHTTDYRRMTGTSFASPIAAAVAARYMERTGIRTFTHVYEYLLGRADSTGTPVFNTPTEEYWMCFFTTNGVLQPYRTNPGTCPAGSIGQNGTSTPVHFPATTNTSGADMIFSDMTCP